VYGKKVIVYVRAADVRMLEEEGKDPASFVRAIVRRALDRKKEAASERV
jgi:hypothetical protein